MKQLRLRLRLVVSLGALVGSISSAVAAPEITEEEAKMAAELHKRISRSFVLSKQLPLDPALRVVANDISSAHLARIQPLLPVWLEEERRVQARAAEKADPGEVFHAVWARLLNELALWHIEPGDAAYEKATLEAIRKSPLFCKTEGDSRLHDFATRMMRVQAMPPAQRQAALATERQLLERWGKPRGEVQPWPHPLPQDAGMSAVARIRAGGPRPPLALPPSLASELLAQGEGYDQQAWETKCVFQQWWLRVSLAQGSAPAAALNAFRYGTLLTATDRLGRAFESEDEDEAKAQSSSKPSYPMLASRFDVTGETTVTRRVDATGKPEQASVTGRKIVVRGIRGTRPVAFENTFDAVAVHYALNSSASAKPGDTQPEVFNMVWNLEPAPSAAPKANSTSKGKTP